MAERTEARPAVFFDRDNTLMVGDDYIGDPERVALMEDAAECVAGVREMGFATVTISNQSGVARGFFTEKDVRAVNKRLDEKLVRNDPRAVIERHEFCPHHPTHGVAPYRQACQCRKPRDGMIRRAAAAMNLDLGHSWLIGDAPRDIEAGASAGLRTILLSADGVSPSPAAKAETRVQPEFKVDSLREALWIIAKETGKQLPAMTAEEQEMDELDEEAPPEVEPEDEPFTDNAGETMSERDETSSSGRATLAWSERRREEELPRDHLPSAAAPDVTYGSPEPRDPATNDRIAQATAQILDDIRRQRETPREDFNFFRLLAGVVQVLAVAAVVWALVMNFNEPRLMLAIFLQLLALTLVSASAR